MTRTYLVYIGMCVFAISIIWKIVNLQFIEGEVWRAKAKSMNVKEFTIEALRGDIYDLNGQLLATSLPYYEVAMDASAPSVNGEEFDSKVDSLSLELSLLFPDKSRRDFEKLLRTARRNH